MLFTKHEITDVINKFDKQILDQVNNKSVTIKLDNREACAILALLKDTLYTTPLIHGWDSNDAIRYKLTRFE